jgi:hypothetical protein
VLGTECSQLLLTLVNLFIEIVNPTQRVNHRDVPRLGDLE